MTAKTSHPQKQTFLISDLKYIKKRPWPSLVQGEQMQDPIEIIQHSMSDKVRYGSMGYPYIEKKYSVKKGSSRINYALENGYTHIEGIIVESYV